MKEYIGRLCSNEGEPFESSEIFSILKYYRKNELARVSITNSQDGGDWV